jgi:drug/metabolite transporter (DMT)-like permease
MVAVTLMWSIAGVVTRHLEATRSFEVTFWRSLINSAALTVMLGVMRGPAALARSIGNGGRVLWASSLCWCVMFTNFMIAITLTTVANVLITMSIAPLLTALVARFALGHRLPLRTWGAIVVAGIGIGWMYGSEVAGSESRHVVGTLVAVGVPIAAAINWTMIQHDSRSGARRDMLPAVLIGAVLSVLVSLPLALPLSASLHDIGLLGLLGVVQLAIPCVVAVTAARVLSAPEVSLLALLEVVFGVAWAWLGAGEAPSASVLAGGALVLGALAANEAIAMRNSSRRGTPLPGPTSGCRQ